MKKANIFVSILTLFVACFGIFVGCGSKGSIEITSESGICSVAPSETLQIKKSLKKVDAENVSFSIIEGGEQAYITNDGLLTANNDATVGTELKIQAESKKDGVKSNVLVVTITNKLTSAISITSDRNFLTENIKSLQLSAIFDNYVTDRNVTWSVSSDSSFVTVDTNGKVSLVENTEAYPQNNTSFKIKATYDSDQTIFGEIELTYLLPHTSLSAIAVENVIINAQSDSEKYITISGFGENDVEYGTIDAEYFTFTSSNPSVATVTAQGKIEVHGHGKAEITVTLNDGNSNISRKGNVYVFATPNSISFDASKTGSYVANTANKMSFGKGDALKLYDMLAFSNSEGLAGCTAVKYFVNGVERTYSDGLSFSEEGEVTVKVVADPTIDGVSAEDMPTLTPVEFEFKLNVNNGVNIKTVSQFQAFANQTTNTTANILCDIVLTSTENFGKEDGTDKWATVSFLGDRYINGNGYSLNAQALPVSQAGGNSLLHFKRPLNSPAYYVVQIKNFTMIGQATISGVYANDNRIPVINTEGKANGIYRYGLRVNEGMSSETQKTYVKDFILENVTFKQFYTALRVHHAVDGLMDNVYIDNCFANGGEMVQNIMEVRNIHIGKVGAFGIEITPDDMLDKDTESPKGTSGVNFNQTQQITFTGTVQSENYNTVTPYMQGLDKMVKQITENKIETMAGLIEAIVGGTISGVWDAANKAYPSNYNDQNKVQIQGQMLQLVNSIMKKDGKINFFSLIFVDPTDYPNYHKGNAEGLFTDFSGKSNVKNIQEILAEFLQSPDSYTAYKNYQYVIIDLAVGDANLGQVMIINEAYEAPNA